MSEFISHLALGFATALSLQNLALCFVGCMVGTLIGVLPGVGPIATIAMLMPLTFKLDPTGALIMLAGIYYGAQYGGSTTAILVNIPGEATAVVTTLDGHQMAKQGRSGVALGIAAIGSFIAGTISTLIIAALAIPLTKLALLFGPAEYFSLMVLGLAFATVLARGSVFKAIGMIVAGLLLSTVGTDLETGEERLTFGFSGVADGIDFAVLAMGLFGFSEVLRNLETPETRDVVRMAIGRLLPSMEDFKRAWPAVLRGTALGSVLGVLPGGGATLSSFAAYALEKKTSRTPEQFGRGAVEGVAGPESANNAGALTIHGIQPGPQIMTERPEMFWGMVASMWIGNLMLVIINLPLIGMWVQLLKVPYRVLYLSILLFCGIGVYTVNNSAFDVLMAAFFGVFGYVFIRLQCEPAPMILGFVLGPLMEESLRRAMRISSGDPMIFVNRPISLGLLIAAVFLLIIVALPAIRSKREEAFQES